jgi:F-type H+-transporting ATPase subunit delta
VQGSSRASLAAAQKRLTAATTPASGKASGKGAVDAMALGDELFAVTAALDSSATLRRALTDPGRESDARSALIEQLFGGKLSADALDLARAVASSRWSTSGDIADAFEALAIASVVIAADAAGQLGALEDELFRFERTVQGNHDLRDALADRRGDAAAKADLVATLLRGKASEATVRLARQAVLAPRGRRLEASLELYLAAAAARREQFVAHATVAAPLSAKHQDRLQAALSKVFSHEVQLNVDVDPTIVGGVRVEVGDEVVDGSILRRLEEAQRRLAG